MAHLNLERLMVLVNEIPAEGMPDTTKPLYEVGVHGDLNRAISEIRGSIARLPKALRDFVGKVEQATLPTIHDRCLLLRDAQGIIRELAQLDKRLMTGRVVPLGTVDLVMHTDANGRIEFAPSVLGSALKGKEIGRIRLCPVCDGVFWAHRKDQPCCSTVHAKIRRTRKWPNRI